MAADSIHFSIELGSVTRKFIAAELSFVTDDLKAILEPSAAFKEWIVKTSSRSRQQTRVDAITDWPAFLRRHPQHGNESKPFIVTRHIVPTVELQRYREFRGPIASKVRQIADLLRRQFPDSELTTKEERILVRRAYSLGMFGIVSWEFLQLDAVKRLGADELLDAQLASFCLPHQFEFTLASLSAFPGIERKLGLITQPIDNTLAQFLIQNGDTVQLKIPANLTHANRVNFMMECAWSALISYHNVPYCAPEAQPLQFFWTPLLDACLITPSAGLLVGTSEFYTNKIGTGDLASFLDLDQRIDYVACFQDKPSLPPLMIIEGAGHALSPDVNSSVSRHKDERKLACTMSICLRHYMGLFSKNKSAQKELIVFGALIAKTQIQYCVMYPVFPEDGESKYSLVFQTSRHWLNDFARSSGLCLDNAECTKHTCEQYCPGAIDASLIDPVGWADRRSLDVQVAGDNMASNAPSEYSIETDSEAKSSPAPQFGARTEPASVDAADLFDGFFSQDIDHLSDCVCDLATFCAFATDRIRGIKKMVDDLTPENIGTPDVLPPELLTKSRFPTSFMTHDKEFPPNTDDTPVSKHKRRRTDASAESPTASTSRATSDKNIVATHVAIHKVKKDGSQRDIFNEVEVLKALKNSVGIVQLLDYKIEGDQITLFEEPLIEWPDIEQRDVAQLFPVTVQFVLDISRALESLRKEGIIHRDISPNNIMYSPVEHRFKLIDFDLAVFAEGSSGEYHQKPTQTGYSPCGTEHCIAPELFQGAPYSWKTDMYGLGGSFMYVVEPLEFYVDTIDKENQHMGLVETLQDLILEGLLNRDPEKRWTPEETYIRLLPIYDKVFRAFQHRKTYLPTWYDAIVNIRK